ncbi:MAG: hypothetical protein JRI84_12660 [Deltaproteobacteria bacterium]|nr:hypothetical protein [Deltaproteobacteria bacterium]
MGGRRLRRAEAHRQAEGILEAEGHGGENDSHAPCSFRDAGQKAENFEMGIHQ